ncbi:MAG: flagellar protein FlbD [Armatimonadetes bacterium]|nr:flagellar protein FlbD [Armatimonadota bacterium]
MIHLNRINGQPIVVNADLIEMLEVTPEVVLVLTTGRRLVVKQSVDEVVEAVVRYQQAIRVHQRPPLHIVAEKIPGDGGVDG